MLHFTQGNLLEARTDALVNTVNTVGIMGKGIALMFKEAFPENYEEYAAACERGEVRVGHMFVTEPRRMDGPKWIINFPTKEHWRYPSKIEWIDQGLVDLKRVIREKSIQSLALPPLGSGNGGLEWSVVRRRIEIALADLDDVKVVVFEPTAKYQNVAKRKGVQKLTAARALIAEIVRRYWVLGIECSLLEVQKLAYFLEHFIKTLRLDDPLKLQFQADRYGPYSNRLVHLLNALDGSYLHSDKRIADASILDPIRFADPKRNMIELYLKTEAKQFLPALEAATSFIDGFESPLGMELLATVHWLAHRMDVSLDVTAVKAGLDRWPGGARAAERKRQLFNDRLLSLAVERLRSSNSGTFIVI